MHWIAITEDIMTFINLGMGYVGLDNLFLPLLLTTSE